MSLPNELNNSEIADLKQQFVENGYVVVDSGLSENILDGARADTTPYFVRHTNQPEDVPYADRNRVQDAWYVSNNVLAVAQSKRIAEILQALYDGPMLPFQTLNFRAGTQQPVHADSIHFNSEPFGSMCGVWTALEDIGQDQGPLVYYPGSQRLPEMNYADFKLPASPEFYPQYLDEIKKIIEREGFKPELGVVSKGQAIIWSANILHGGSHQNDKTLTRHSQVTHYYREGAKYWRPSLSWPGRRYFEPDWVRDVSHEPPASFLPAPMFSKGFVERVSDGVFRRVRALFW